MHRLNACVGKLLPCIPKCSSLLEVLISILGVNGKVVIEG